MTHPTTRHLLHTCLTLAALLLTAAPAAHAQTARPAPLRVMVATPDEEDATSVERATAPVFAKSPNLTRVPASTLPPMATRYGLALPDLASTTPGALLCALRVETLIWVQRDINPSIWNITTFGPSGEVLARFTIARPLTDAGAQMMLARSVRLAAPLALTQRATPTPCAPPPTSAATPTLTPKPKTTPRTTAARRPPIGLRLPTYYLSLETGWLFLQDDVATRSTRRHRVTLESTELRPTSRLALPCRVGFSWSGGDPAAFGIEARGGVRYLILPTLAAHLRGIYQWQEQPAVDDTRALGEPDSQTTVYGFIAEGGFSVGGTVFESELTGRAGRREGGGETSAVYGAALSSIVRPINFIALRAGLLFERGDSPGPLPDTSLTVHVGIGVTL